MVKVAGSSCRVKAWGSSKWGLRFEFGCAGNKPYTPKSLNP